MKKLLSIMTAFAVVATGTVAAVTVAAGVFAATSLTPVYAETSVITEGAEDTAANETEKTIEPGHYYCAYSEDREEITSMDQCEWVATSYRSHALLCKQHGKEVLLATEVEGAFTNIQHDAPGFGGFNSLPDWVDECTLGDCPEFRQAARDGKYICYTDDYTQEHYHLVDPADCEWDEFVYSDISAHVVICKEHNFPVYIFDNESDKYAGKLHPAEDYNPECTLCRARPIDTAKLTLPASVVYSGKARTPLGAVTLKGKTLMAGEDYTVEYTNNRNVGTATVKVIGCGSYEGYVVKTFRINPKGTTLNTPAKLARGFKAKWACQSAKMATSRVTGYQVRYSAKKSMAGANIKTVKGYGKTSVKVGNLKAKKKYFVQVRTYKTVNGKKYYSAWSVRKAVTTR